jgi:hypothetical protein
VNNGELGIVIGQNPVRRLRPKVILVLDAEKIPLGITPIRDLMVESQALDGRELNIRKSPEPGTYDIHPDEFYL